MVERELGRGASAVVLRVRHATLGGAFALKVPFDPGPEAAHRLVEEARVQGRLRHPNVVRVVDVVWADDAVGLVLQLVAGPTLRDWIADRPAWPVVEELADGLLRGVGAAHALGLVHRDLKPSNVLVEPVAGGLVARVTDFGTTVRAGREVGGGSGTLAYQAPEALLSPADPRADVWSLGVLLHELVTGRRPARRAGLDAPPPDVPDRVWAALGSALALRPADRPPDAEELRRLWIGSTGAPHLVRRPPPPPATPEIERPPAVTSGETWAEHDGRATWWEPARPQVATPRDVFCGRLEELAQLRRLASSGLLVLGGLGGVGKSRLVRELSLTGFEAVAWCDLTDVDSVDGALARLGAAVVSPAALQAIADAVDRRGRCLLVLDAAEALGARLPPLVRELAALAPSASLVVTTRDPRPFDPCPTLIVPPLARTDALSLFEARARVVRPGFLVTPALAPVVDAVLDRLDGLPLAVELAAARLRAVRCEALPGLLADRFALLAAPRAPHPRHASVAAVLDATLALLTPDEKEDLMRLAAASPSVPGQDDGTLEGLLALGLIRREGVGLVVPTLVQERISCGYSSSTGMLCSSANSR